MRPAALVAVLLGLLLISAPGAAAKVPFGFFGVDADGLILDPALNVDSQFGSMAHVGVESALTEINWNAIQPDAASPPDFSRVDRIVLAAARRGIRLAGTPLYAPPWASVDPSTGASPPEPGAYATFLREVVGRYGPGGSLWAEHPDVPKLPIREWQIWNEPASPLYWSKQPFAKAYVKLLRASRTALRAADPGAKVLLAGLTYRSWQDLPKIYKAGGRGLFDVVTLHPYALRVADVISIIKLNRRVMNAHHDRRVPIDVGETSWPSAKGVTRDHYGYEVTEKGEAAKLREAFPAYARERTKLGIRRVLWSTWLTKDTGSFTFDYSGLNKLRKGRVVAKPALGAYRSTVLALEGCRRKGATARRCG